MPIGIGIYQSRGNGDWEHGSFSGGWPTSDWPGAAMQVTGVGVIEAPEFWRWEIGRWNISGGGGGNLAET